MCRFGPCSGLCRLAHPRAACWHRVPAPAPWAPILHHSAPAPCHPAPAPCHPAPAPCHPAPAPAPTPAPAPCHSVPIPAPAPLPAPAPVKVFSPGICYVLLNARGGTAMDLSGTDSTSLIGYPTHGGPNQQWDFIPCGLGYLIRCERPDNDGHALYLTVDCGGARDHAPVVASAHPVVWNVEQTQQGIIVSWPNSKYVFDLADNVACTKIQLMPRIPGELCQLWRPDERGRVPDASEAPAVAVCHVAADFTPGAYYVLLNARGGTAMDLSGADSTSIIGYPKHGGPNQQWEFIPSGHGCFIRCVRPSEDGHGLYLALDCGGARDCAPVVASAHPVAWNVEQTGEGIIISWPNSKFVFDLADNAACTKIQLKPLIPGELCQLWRSTEVTAECK